VSERARAIASYAASATAIWTCPRAYGPCAHPRGRGCGCGCGCARTRMSTIDADSSYASDDASGDAWRTISDGDASCPSSPGIGSASASATPSMTPNDLAP
jgi:hypothetical protein